MNETINATGDGLAAVLEAGKTLGLQEALVMPEAQIVIVPPGHEVKNLAKLRQEIRDQLADAPLRKRGTATFHDAVSFVAYVNDHKDEDSHFFADMAGDARVYLDHHRRGAEGPRWGEHVASFKPPLDPDWLAWQRGDNDLRPQIEFAQFIEDQIPNILEPDGAELLDMVQDLTMASDMRWSRSERLDSGAINFMLVDEPTQKLGRKNVELPKEMTIGLPIFRKGERVVMVAKLRHRLREGELKLGYHLHRPHEAVDQAFGAMIEAIEKDIGMVALWGSSAYAAAR